jgi:acyl dehydratase
MTRRYFEDITDGEHLNCQNVIITREDIITFATKFDPQPFHTDEDAAKESIFGGLIASSLHILSACTRAVVEAQGDVAILSGVGMDNMAIVTSWLAKIQVRPKEIKKSIRRSYSDVYKDS